MLEINNAKDFVRNNLFKEVREDFRQVKQNTKPQNKLIPQISTSQIRKFLSAVNKINNKIKYQNDSDILSEDIVAEIAYMRVQFAYIVGKNKIGKNKNGSFEKLHEELDKAMIEIKNSKSKFINFARYVEAIIAYHKFYGGND